MRVSVCDDRLSTDLQRKMLRLAGVEPRHLFEDHSSDGKDERVGLAQALEFVQPGDTLVVSKLDRLGRSVTHLVSILNSLKEKQVEFRSLTEYLDTTAPSCECLWDVFGALAEYERTLTTERIVAGQATARKRGWIHGRPLAITGEKLDAIIAALDGGMSKSEVCRSFKVKRSTLLDTLARVGWPASNTPSTGRELGQCSDPPSPSFTGSRSVNRP